jgi:outer membrane protein TolC
LTAYASGSHPEVLKLQVKIAQLDIEKRWRRNDLLPDLRFKYKYFFLPPTSDPKFFLEQPDYFGTTYQRQNFQFGFDLTVPLLLRKERGKLELTRAKLEQSRLELDFARRHVVAEVQAAYNEMQAFDALIRTQRQTVANSLALLEAERVRFAAGESSLFLINARERNLITAQMKLVELEAKYFKSLAQFYWASGLPYDSWQP